MTVIKTIPIITGFYVTTVIVPDITGVLVNSLFYLFAGRSKLLNYTAWFVLAIFAGMPCFSIANDYVMTIETFQKNSWVIIFMAVVLSTMAILFFYAYGQIEESDM